jgi:hypothetical protein
MSDPEVLPSAYVLLAYNQKVKSTEVATNSQRPVWRVGSHKSEFTLCVSPFTVFRCVLSEAGTDLSTL